MIQKVVFVIFRKNGLITDRTPFIQSMMDGFEKECRNKEVEAHILTLNQEDTDFSSQLQKLRGEENGIVLLGTEMDQEDLEQFMDLKAPCVLLDYWDEKMRFHSVCTCNEYATYEAVNRLIQGGHGKIGYLKGVSRVKALLEREEGYHRALREHHCLQDGKYEVTVRTTMEEAYQDMLQYIKKKNELPTAFVSDNDLIALGAMRAMQKCGIRIPEDVSIIGFDDLPMTGLSQPNLSSIRVPKQEMGKLATRKVIELMNGEGSAISKTQVLPELIVRDSMKMN